jgi:hypothetical protein
MVGISTPSVHLPRSVCCSEEDPRPLRPRRWSTHLLPWINVPKSARKAIKLSPKPFCGTNGDYPANHASYRLDGVLCRREVTRSKFRGSGAKAWYRFDPDEPHERMVGEQLGAAELRVHRRVQLGQVADPDGAPGRAGGWVR